jgi:hypothetical protein
MSIKKINLLHGHWKYLSSFILSSIVFLFAAIVFGFNAKNFHRHGNTMVTPSQKKGSELAITGLLLMGISAIIFFLTLILFYHSKTHPLVQYPPPVK